MSKYLITGGTGFVGSNIAKRLIKQKHEVSIIGHKAENHIPEAKYIECNFNGINIDDLERYDAVFHQAANNDTLDLNEKSMIRANVESPLWLFYYIASLGCNRFIYASSTAVYGNSEPPYIEDQSKIEPLNPYGKSKALFEILASKFAERTNSTVIGLRYCNVYGPGECHKGKRASMIMQMANRMISGLPPKLFKFGEQTRDWIHVEDVVDANIAALECDESDTMNCGSGVATSFKDICNFINHELETCLNPIWTGNPYKSRYQGKTQCDISKIKNKLNFEPRITIEKGIQSYVKWLKNKRQA